ncbi:hypothetical protein [Oceanicaulis alexandrii]|uniref:hypothetical protein n=1 Tax=Oceanicaulis alexandrii TaxID=153233 RepID=UPI0012EB5D09|nr:hypothetical protein [Oceanicaulis alexandrii]
MPIFENESKMQDWLQGQFDNGVGLGDLIDRQQDIEDANWKTEDERAIGESFNYVLEYSYCTSVLSANKNISDTKGEILKPDFVLYEAESEGILVVELKNFSQATREAGTEIGAYSGEIKSQLPFMADADIMGVVISPDWPTLIRRYVMQEILWRKRKMLCLEPVETCDGIRLRTLNVNTLVPNGSTPKISAHYLGGHHICLYDHDLQAGSDDRERFVPLENQMKSSLRMLAAEGESHGLTGFAFLWKDGWELSLAPYMLTLVNFAPFQQLDSLLFELGSVKKATRFQEALFRINSEFGPDGNSAACFAQTRVARSLLEPFCNPHIEGLHGWSVLREEISKRNQKLIGFEAWGAFAARHLEVLKNSYAAGQTVEYNDGQIGWSFVESLVDLEADNFDWDYLFYDPAEDQA